jgi:hypothetical protein
VDISVSGTEPPPQAAANGGNNGGDNSGRGSDNGGPVPTGEIVPSRIDNVKWMVIACFAAIFALGAAMLLRRSEPVPRDETLAVAGSVRVAGPFAQESAAASGIPPTATAPAVSGAMRQTERAVQGSLEEIKDRLFRLELRHQAGTISEAEYRRQRSESEKVLYGFLQG